MPLIIPLEKILPDAILVFFLSIPPYQSERLLGILTQLDPVSRQDALTIGDPESRWIFCCAHHLHRQFCLQYGYGDVLIEKGPTGKPMMRTPDRTVPVHFSLSHTQGMVACAISRDLELGLDVEAIDAAADLGTLAAHFLSTAEQNTIRSAPDDARTRMIYHYWTMKEAVLKAMGTGLARDPKDISVALLNGATQSAPDGATQSAPDGAGDRYFMASRHEAHHVLSVAASVSSEISPIVQWYEVTWYEQDIIFN